MLCSRGMTAWVDSVGRVILWTHIGYQVAANNNVLLNKYVAIIV